MRGYNGLKMAEKNVTHYLVKHPYDFAVHHLRKLGLEHRSVADVMRAQIDFFDSKVLRFPGWEEDSRYHYSFMDLPLNTSTGIAFHNGVIKIDPKSRRLLDIRPSHIDSVILTEDEFKAMDGTAISKDDYSKFTSSYPRGFSFLREDPNVKRAKDDPLWLAACGGNKSLISDYVDMITHRVWGENKVMFGELMLINTGMGGYSDRIPLDAPVLSPLQIGEPKKGSELKAISTHDDEGFVVTSNQIISPKLFEKVDKGSAVWHLRRKGFIGKGVYISGTHGKYYFEFRPGNYPTISPISDFRLVYVHLGGLNGKSGLEREFLTQISQSIAKKHKIGIEIVLDDYYGHSGNYNSGILFKIENKNGVTEGGLDALVKSVRKFNKLVKSDKIRKNINDTKGKIVSSINDIVFSD